MLRFLFSPLSFLLLFPHRGSDDKSFSAVRVGLNPDVLVPAEICDEASLVLADILALRAPYLSRNPVFGRCIVALMTMTMKRMTTIPAAANNILRKRVIYRVSFDRTDRCSFNINEKVTSEIPEDNF